MPDESWCHCKGRVARIERLRRQLAYVRDQADHPDGSVDPVRLALQLQLIAFIEFAEDDAEIKDSIPEMHKLLEALVDLQDGVRNPLLAPRRKKGGRPPPPFLDASMRGRYAAVMHWLMGPEHRMGAQPAANFVVSHGNLRRLLPKRRNAAPPWKVVSNWRDAATGGPGAEDASQAARAGFDAMLKLIKQDQIARPGLDPESRAKRLLHGVTAYYRENLV